MENANLKLVEDGNVNLARLINTGEFCSILDSIGTIHITKNCLKYSLIDIEYVKSRF
ncbi:MAG: hypothetical protein ACR2NW_01845 [Thermodesulfobacteriota bacterium]